MDYRTAIGNNQHVCGESELLETSHWNIGKDEIKINFAEIQAEMNMSVNNSAMVVSLTKMNI